MNQNYHLDVAPTEYAPSFDEKHSYTVRLPQGQLLARGSAFMKSLLDTARVAFSHNEPSKRDIVVTVPPGTAFMFFDFVDFFRNERCNVKIVEGKANDFVRFDAIDCLEWTCVDRRLDDRGAAGNDGVEDGSTEDEKAEIDSADFKDTDEHFAALEKWINDPYLGQITHPGAIAFLHPDVADHVPPHHKDYLINISRQIMQNRWAIKEIVLHAGIDGAPGCGGINVANRGGAEIYTLEKHLTIVREVRDNFRELMDTMCNIFVQLVDPENRVTTVNADDEGARKELLRGRYCV